MADKLKPWRDELLKRLDEVCSRDGRVPRHVAENLVAGSAWWESHPSGPVRAPRHADRLDGGERNWSVEFGANSFLVSAAVHDCCQCIRQWIQQQQALPVPVKSWEMLAGELTSIVRGSVANYRGDTYSGYGHGTQGKLIFGAQAIYVNDFVGGIAGYLKTPALHTFQKRGTTTSTPSTPRTKGKAKVPLIPGRVICPHCQAEVNASKLDGHLRERCPKRQGNVKPVAAPKVPKQPVKPPVKPPLTTKLGPGIVVCPRCQIPVKAEHLKTHLAKTCTGCSTPASREKAAPAAAASPVQQLMPRPLGKNEVVCPWCDRRMNKATLPGHQSDRCPNRPSLSAKISEG